MYQSLLKIINGYLRDKKSVMELGCGNGKLINQIAASNPQLEKIVAVDFYNEPQELHSKINFIKQDLESFASEEYFDLVILNQVLEHIKNPLGLLEKIKPHLKKHGRILIIVPNRNGFSNEARVYLPEHGKHYFLWDRESLQYSLERLGFACRFHNLYSANSHNAFLKYVPALFRIQNPNLICMAMRED